MMRITFRNTCRLLGIAAALLAARGVVAQAQEKEAQAPADPLPRRAWLGAVLEPGEGGSGVRIRALLPGSSAEAAGLKPGDLVKSIDETSFDGVPALVRALRQLPGGREVKVGIERDGNAQSLSMKLKEWPRESDTDAYTVEYGSVPSSAGRLRTITYVPKGNAHAPAGGKRPALLIIQGLGSATLDNPRPDEPVDRPIGMTVYRTIADALAREGYVVTRVDKGGCGDSEGDPAALDFHGELDGYRQALKALKGRPDVDSDNLFIFGHSMGGVFGPMLAAETPIKGLAVYGTVIKTWLEYVLENERRQSLLAGNDYAELDRAVRLSERFQHEFVVNKKPPAQILEEHPDLEPVRENAGLSPDGKTLFGRNHTFFQQLYDQNMPEFWAKHGGHALALWGEAEFVSGRDCHEAIAAIVNAKNPGRGIFRVVEQSDHGFSRASDAADAMQAMRDNTPGQPPESRFNPAIIEVLREWMNNLSRES